MHWLALLILALPPSQPPAMPELCDLMSQASCLQAPAPFVSAGTDCTQGSFVAAAKGFAQAATALGDEAERLFYNGREKDLPEAKAFMDKYARGEKPILKLRGDRFALTMELLAWGAYLHCKSADVEGGLTLLKAGWLDWADEKLRADAALLMLSSTSPDRAKGYLASPPESPEQTLAYALHECRAGNQETGKKWLGFAAGKVEDRARKQKIKALEPTCGK
jgi:hypothetical protein